MGNQAQPNLADLAEPVAMSTLRGTVLETRDADFKIFTRGMEIEKAAAGTGDGKTRIKCIASSSIEDRHGDTITEECIRGMARQAVGLTIFRNHSYNVPLDVFGFVETAKTRKMTVAAAKEKGLVPDHITSADTAELAFLELGIVVDDSNPLSNQTVSSLENGVTLGISIGAMILEYTEKDTDSDAWFPPLIISQVDLLEASVVGIPANPLSWVEGATKAIAIQKGLVGERSTREDLYKAIARQKEEAAPDPEPAPEEPDETEPEVEDSSTSDEAEEPAVEAAIEPNHTQDDPPAIVNYYRHLIHDDLSDEEEGDGKPSAGELKVLVADALMAWKGSHPTDDEVDELLDAINEDRPLEAELDPNADADSTEESDADTDAQEAPEGSDPETAEGTDPAEAEKQAKAEVQKLIEAGGLESLVGAVKLLERTLAQLIETQAENARLEAENKAYAGRLQTAEEDISKAVDFVNKVMDLPLKAKSSVRAEGTVISSRLLEAYGDVLDLTGKGSS